MRRGINLACAQTFVNFTFNKQRLNGFKGVQCNINPKQILAYWLSGWKYTVRGLCQIMERGIQSLAQCCSLVMLFRPALRKIKWMGKFFLRTKTWMKRFKLKIERLLYFLKVRIEDDKGVFTLMTKSAFGLLFKNRKKIINWQFFFQSQNINEEI